MEPLWERYLEGPAASLAGHLTLENVAVRQSEQAVTVSFSADRLVEDEVYLAARRAFRRAFAPMRVDLIIRSPKLAADFLEDPERYAAFLHHCITRRHPPFGPFFERCQYKMREGKLVVQLQDDIAVSLLMDAGIDTYLSKLVRNVFVTEIGVVFESIPLLEEQREEIRRLREEEEKRALEQMLREQKVQVQREAAKVERERPILGRSIAQAPMPIHELAEDSGRCVLQGEVLACETRETRSGEMLIASFLLTDYTDTIKCKAFLRYKPARGRKGEEDETPPTPEERQAVERVVAELRKGAYLAVRGEPKMDSFDRCLTFSVNDVERRPKPVRQDKAERKRIELHMHTNMSEMDGISSAKALIEQAAAWGHPAVAITDHGVVQAFPEAFATAGKKGIKLIPGMEGYLTDVVPSVYRADGRALTEDIVVVDFETTGLSPKHNRIIEIGAVRIRNGQIVEEHSCFVHPEEPIPEEVTKITGITDSMVANAATAREEIPKLMAFIGDAVFAAHNARFDYGFLKNECKRLDLPCELPVLDTLELARRVFPQQRSFKLKALCKMLGISLKNAHRAVHDARATAQMLLALIARLREAGIERLDQVEQGMQSGAIGESHHIILLAASQQGMTNLNRIVSEGHLRYFNRRPHTPRTVLQRYREGLIVGSACSEGELFAAILDGKGDEDLKKIARFYDYLEIQPIQNNAYLVREGKVRDEEELRSFNRKIVWLGEQLGIPVCATGDVHFLDEKDAVYRAILQTKLNFRDADAQPPLYFRTTEEMLGEFAYLGRQKAEQVVIDNPAAIAARVGEVGLYPKHPEGKETFQPFWPDADADIRRLCDEKILELYGEQPPEIVLARKEKELRSILGYGYGTLYSIAQKLVKKSNADGYLVGSRGSVGSSLVAHLVGISEVNALPPHYRCEQCKFTDFDVDRAKYHVGVDLPERACPQCGAMLARDGFDIPFEVFLGFKGDKVPDIDLNFSGVYQPKAHAYIEELFGKEYCYRAGTIGTLADKTAYGYVKHYCESKGIDLSAAEMERLAKGCVGVKRTTGQHPAGMVVLPKEYEICQFVAIQHPANDMSSPVITTHYDFGSMHDVLVKLDVLGHDDPTMIRMLMDLTGVDARTVPLTDPKVISLFRETTALGVTPEQIGSNTGTYGVPEFGTAFVRGMLEETKPQTMEELLRISGLSHGTDVWLGNTQDILRAGLAPLSECICCRDDIMNALIAFGVEPKMSFTTMESVRKGKGLTAEMEEAMRTHGVPDWFIGSCKKIKYMFPRGHAVAYVTMALRIAWYKVYHPRAYYCAYFTVRADGFDATLMGGTPEQARAAYNALVQKKRGDGDHFTDKDDDRMTVLELVIEMHCRGIHLAPVDLYKSQAFDFTLEGENLIRMPLRALPGLGGAAAESIVRARQEARFISEEDLLARTALSQTLCDQMRELGALGDLPRTNQMDLFSGLF